MLISSRKDSDNTAAEQQKQRQLRSSPPPPPPPPLLPPNAPFPSSAVADRDKGNEAMASGDASEAVIAYTRALLQLQKEEEGGEEEGESEEAKKLHRRLACSLLLSNRAAARVSLHHFSKASADALESLRWCEGLWWRPWSRLARARAGSGDAAGAAVACRQGIEAVSTKTSSEANLFLLPTKERLAAQQALRAEADSIAMAFAKEGNYNGFDGAVLEVRPAESGSEWLGLPAPRDPQVDSDGDEEDDGEEQSGFRRICSSNSKNALVPSSSSSRRKNKSSFRSLHDALEAAEDGDVIRLLPGTHNGLGRSAFIDKRVLIDGRGATPATTTATTTTLDARGNVPALRFRRPAAVVGLVIDASGFREAVRVDPLSGNGGGRGRGGGNGKTARTRALLADCSVSCSGDDGVVVAGAPTISIPSSSSTAACLSMIRCTITAKRAGVRAFFGGDVEMRDCGIEGCGTHGVAALAVSPSSSSLLPSSSSCSSSRLDLGGRIAAVRCRISSCLEEGALVSGPGSALVLDGCVVSGCGGPAVDASGNRCLVVVRGGGIHSSPCRLSGECGGLWLWDGARARVVGCGGGDGHENSNSNDTTNGVSISSRSTFALLTDGPGTKLSMERCDVRGGIRGAEAASALASRKNNSFCSSFNDDGEEVKDENSSPSRSSLPPRHCGPPPAIGPFRWDGPDPFRVE